MTRLRYGLVGPGAFGTFCIGHYRQSSLIDVRAVADVDADHARRAAASMGVEACASVEALFARDDIDVVHLATPPHTHKALALAALRAGKHVLCEKPLATNVADAQEMLAAARAAGRVLVVNLIMRYDALNAAAARVVRERLLGEPIAAMLTNLAGDWKLAPSHWFWDPAKSGGIFVEHAVHFFDLFAWLFGPATVLSATEGRRPGNDAIVEQVQCVTRHAGQGSAGEGSAGGVIGTQYHGFHQPGLLERQELRITCERGDLRLHGWLTTHVGVDALLDDATAERVAACFPRRPTVARAALKPEERSVLARHRRFDADARFAMEATLGTEKQDLYGQVIRELLEDQARFIADPTHQRQVTEANGLASLELAEAARGLVRSAAR